MTPEQTPEQIRQADSLEHDPHAILGKTWWCGLYGGVANKNTARGDLIDRCRTDDPEGPHRTTYKCGPVLLVKEET